MPGAPGSELLFHVPIITILISEHFGSKLTLFIGHSRGKDARRDLKHNLVGFRSVCFLFPNSISAVHLLLPILYRTSNLLACGGLRSNYGRLHILHRTVRRTWSTCSFSKAFSCQSAAAGSCLGPVRGLENEFAVPYQASLWSKLSDNALSHEPWPRAKRQIAFAKGAPNADG
jgi:hypothetical protein